jgi:toxin-antitoxin system PIN domain toxin
VNVLVALTWPNHVHHRAAVAWFREHRAEGWATCSVSESGFVRVSSNARAIPTAVPPRQAIELLRRLREQPGHTFWTDDVSIATSPEVVVERLGGHRQVTDAHLLALAHRRRGRLATFDRGVEALVRGTRFDASVTLLPTTA